jgi:hypothetical protein
MKNTPWQDMMRALGAIVVLVELRQVLEGQAVDQGLLLLAAGLLGLGSAFRGGNGRE